MAKKPQKMPATKARAEKRQAALTRILPIQKAGVRALGRAKASPKTIKDYISYYRLVSIESESDGVQAQAQFVADYLTSPEDFDLARPSGVRQSWFEPALEAAKTQTP
jgi:hypothetical protein